MKGVARFLASLPNNRRIMGRLGPFSHVAALVATAVFAAGCAAHQPSAGESAMVPAVAAPATSATYAVLHRFGRTPKQHGGDHPASSLLDVGGLLYGTTSSGGKYNDGTVYSVTTAGVKKLLYSFGATSDDGKEPSSDLVVLDGTLYGATYYGGSCAGGTVFGINPNTTSGGYRVLHSFCNTSDGLNPDGGLIAVKGTLYGTTSVEGGTGNSGGTVFKLTTNGEFTVLHAFKGPNDGFQPTGRLAVVQGTIYGTTLYGGGFCYSNGGCGAVYSITTAGKEKVVYGFQGPAQGDGWLAVGGVNAANGVLYGATLLGGEKACSLNRGCGTAYSLTTKGVEDVLVRFEAAAGGQYPSGPPIVINGVLYGTTGWGGGGKCTFDSTLQVGCGVAYSLTPTGSETVLHTFVGDPDGANPASSLTEVNGELYGTTNEGGFGACQVPLQESDAGCGTVFKLAP
jgi:uncharacterized repeat protein (TIGR03803 family)